MDTTLKVVLKMEIETKKLCKNGCGLETYRGRRICKKCVQKEVRDNYEVKKESYNARKRKPKLIVFCKYCNKKIQTIKPNQKFCCLRHKELFHYENRSYYQITKSKARLAIYNKDKKKCNSKKYTQKEEKFIIKNYKVLSNIDIANKLNRTVGGITLKISSLKKELKIIPKNFF